MNSKTHYRRPFNKSVFVLPYLILTLAFIIFPLILLMVYAFKGEDGSFTFANFINVFTNPTHYVTILKTIGIALLSTAICLVIAYPIALVLASSDFNKYTILALLFIVPMWMNFILRIYALKSLLSVFGIDKSFFAAIIGLVYDFLPFMLLPIYTILANMDKSYGEASRDLGAGGFKTFVKVTLPLSVPGIVSGIMMVFMPIFSAYAVTTVLGDGGTNLIGGKISDIFGGGEENWGVGSALSFILLLMVFLIMFLGTVFTNRKTKALTAHSLIGGGKGV